MAFVFHFVGKVQECRMLLSLQFHFLGKLFNLLEFKYSIRFEFKLEFEY
jgi:hypothetical protein